MLFWFVVCLLSSEGKETQKTFLRQDKILEKKRKKKCIYIPETNKPGRNFSYQLRHLKIQKNEVLDSKAQETKNEKVKK